MCDNNFNNNNDNDKNDKNNKGDEDMGITKPRHPTRISANTKEEQMKFVRIAEDQKEPSDYVKSVIKRYRESKNAKKTQ